MNKSAEEQISRLLNDAYLDLMNQERRRLSLDEFADWLTEKSGKRISIVNLSRWMNAKHPPAGDNAHALAAVFGTQIYEILGMEHFTPPTMALRQIEKQWPKLTPDERNEILRIINENNPQMVLAPNI